MQRKNFRNVDEREAISSNLFRYISQLLRENALRHFRTQIDLTIFIIVDLDLSEGYREFENSY